MKRMKTEEKAMADKIRVLLTEEEVDAKLMRLRQRSVRTMPESRFT